MRQAHPLAAVLVLTGLAGCPSAPRAPSRAPLRIAVMDPLAAELACECVQGYAQRRYGRLAAFLEARLRRPVRLAFAESLERGLTRLGGHADLVIGKRSLVLYDAARARLPVHPIARLTDKEGSTSFWGLFVVRRDDPAKSLADLKGRRILLGPQESAEKHAAALAALDEHGLPTPAGLPVSPGCNAAAVAVLEGEADTAVLSSYALALLEGCHTIDKGALRIIARTPPVPFVTVFATASATDTGQQALLDALLAVRTDPALLTAMESRDGFLPMPRTPSPDWSDWRGPRRDGLSPDVPTALPTRKRLLWKRPLAGLGLSGVAATGRHVVVADKEDKRNDVFRCLDAETGTQLWALSYPAPGKLDYSNAPRAAPVVCDGLVYLLGAFGHLHCVRLETGEVAWKRNVAEEFRAELTAWGLCATPLVVDDKLIVNPGAKDASLIALDRRTGKLLWQSPGRQAAYASFLVGTFGGVRQIVGYDAETLGGWDPETGRRLWELRPEVDGDFNVPTPLALDGKLLVASENNGTRLHGFDRQGRIVPKPLAHNPDLAPDTATPVALDGKLFGGFGKLLCLDAADGLKTLWSQTDDTAFDDHVAIIGGNGRLLVTTTRGELLLVRATGRRYELLGRLPLIRQAEVELWAHPALVGDRLYVRDQAAVYCLRLAEGE